MVCKTDPMESFFESLPAVRNAFLPLESGLRKMAKDIESCWPGLKNGARKFELRVPHLIVDGNFSGKKGGVSSGKKKKSVECMVGDEKKKGVPVKLPAKAFLGMFSQSCGSNGPTKADVSRKESGERDSIKEEGTCVNCLQFAVAWSIFLNSFVQAFPSPFKARKRRFQKRSDDSIWFNSSADETKPKMSHEIKPKEFKGRLTINFHKVCLKVKEGKFVPIDCFFSVLFDQLTQNLWKFDQGLKENEGRIYDSAHCSSRSDQFDCLGVVTSIFGGKNVDFSGFLSSLKFAKVGGVPPGIVGEAVSVNNESNGNVNPSNPEESCVNTPQKLANGLLSIPLSNVERLRSTLSTVSLTELIELVPHLGRSSKDHPDKKKLFSVQDFFRYTEAEGRRFFEELDRDGDGHVTLEDLEIAMRKRKLPRRYAKEFMHRARSHLFSKSFGWKQFLSMMEQKEPTILRAFTSLCLSKSGTLQKSEILATLKNAGLPANEDNAAAMMRFLNVDTEESISYGHFRNFMLLLPSDRLQEDPRSIWFEAATVVAVAPPVEIPAGSVLKSALAGGLSCALSTSLMHPIDSIKTRVQASTLSFPEIISKLPQIGVRGLYRGSIPAIIGQFSSHGLRTGIFEASKLVLIRIAPTLPDIQVQSVSSFLSTFLGTAVRIPCEVLKQRLQAGIFDNVGEAISGTWHQDGLKGFFRGTGATLCREVPFYVAGMCLYAESKKAVQHLLRRELEPWETIAVGALSGGLAAVVTTPFDVMKTRMMTAPPGRSVSMSMVAYSILCHEGPLGLFKGAIPRFFWIAPLGAMNFAGYELAKKAMDKNDEQKGELLLRKA